MPRYLLMSVKQHENRQSTQPATDNPPKPQAVMWCDFAAKLPTAPQFTVCASDLKNLEDIRPRKGFDKLSPNAGV
jgi:hypothetical protein